MASCKDQRMRFRYGIQSWHWLQVPKQPVVPTARVLTVLKQFVLSAFSPNKNPPGDPLFISK